MQAYLAEFVGTLILILLGDGVVAAVLLRNSKAEHSGWIVITLGWGMAVAIAVYAVAAVSGAHINPAVTIGLASVGIFPWAQVPGYIIAQILGAFVGAVLVWITYYDHWKETDDPTLKLGVFSTIPQIRNTVPNFITEVIGTAMLLFGVLALVAHTAPFSQGGIIFPLLVGFLVLAIGLSLGGPTGYAINPARDLGPRIAHAVLPIPGKGDSDFSYGWIPVVAPLVGGIIGAVLWSILGFGG